MNLITKAIEKKLERFPAYSQDGKGLDAEVILKLFGGSSYTLLVTEAERGRDGSWVFYGYATIDGKYWEWGYTNFNEIKAVRFPPFGLGVERDLHVPDGAKVRDLVKG